MRTMTSDKLPYVISYFLQTGSNLVQWLGIETVNETEKVTTCIYVCTGTGMRQADELCLLEHGGGCHVH